MANNTLSYNPAKVTGATSGTIDFSDVDLPDGQEYTVFCKVSSGTFYLSVGKAPDSNYSPAWTSSDTIPPLTLRNNKVVLHWESASSADILFVGKCND